MPPEPSRKKTKQLEVMVAETVRETPDTTTLVLFTGNDHLEYRPGHFLTIDPHQFHALERFTAFLEDQKGKKEPPRAYSLASAPHEKYLAITVKEETYTSGVTKYPPLLSPILTHRIRIGARMEVTGFTGPYVLPEDIEDRTDHIVHVCAGSGSVPNLSIVKHALHEGLKPKHTFMYTNKTWEDVIFRDELEALAHDFPDKLKIVHSLTREQGELNGATKGRINLELLKKHVPDASTAEFFVCGPAATRWEKQRAKQSGEPAPVRFMESALGLLEELGVEKKRVHKESYG